MASEKSAPKKASSSTARRKSPTFCTLWFEFPHPLLGPDPKPSHTSLTHLQDHRTPSENDEWCFLMQASHGSHRTPNLETRRRESAQRRQPQQQSSHRQISDDPSFEFQSMCTSAVLVLAASEEYNFSQTRPNKRLTHQQKTTREKCTRRETATAHSLAHACMTKHQSSYCKCKTCCNVCGSLLHGSTGRKHGTYTSHTVRILPNGTLCLRHLARPQPPRSRGRLALGRRRLHLQDPSFTCTKLANT